MNNKQRQFVGESYIEMHQSLLDAVKQAGGDGTGFYYDEIKDMTVSTLFNKLATNGIRFTREIPEDNQEEMFDCNKFKEELERSKLGVMPEREPQDYYYKIGNIIRLGIAYNEFIDYMLCWTGNNNAHLINFMTGEVWSEKPLYTAGQKVTLTHLNDFLFSSERCAMPLNYYCKVADNIKEYFENQKNATLNDILESFKQAGVKQEMRDYFNDIS